MFVIWFYNQETDLMPSKVQTDDIGVARYMWNMLKHTHRMLSAKP